MPLLRRLSPNDHKAIAIKAENKVPIEDFSCPYGDVVHECEVVVNRTSFSKGILTTITRNGEVTLSTFEEF